MSDNYQLYYCYFKASVPIIRRKIKYEQILQLLQSCGLECLTNARNVYIFVLLIEFSSEMYLYLDLYINIY